MGKNLKLVLVTLILIVIPQFYFITNCVTSSKYFFWEYKCSYPVIVVNIVVLLGSILVIYLNKRWQPSTIYWYLIGGFFLLSSALHFLSLYSLSNFGF